MTQHPLSDQSLNDAFIVMAARSIRDAWPLMVFYSVEILIGITDLLIVGRLGLTELAALGLAKTVIMAYLMIGMAGLSPALVLLAQNIRPSRLQAVLVTSSVCAILLAIGGMVLFAMSVKVLSYVGYSEAFMEQYKAYGYVMSWALLPMLLLSQGKYVVNVMAHSSVLVRLGLMMVLGNALLGLVLVHGWYGIAGWGITGAGWATLLVNVLAVLWLVKYLRQVDVMTRWYKMPLYYYRLLGRRLWSSGVFMALQQLVDSAYFTILLVCLGVFSETWVAIGAIMMTLLEVNFIIGNAFGEMACVQLSRWYKRAQKCAVFCRSHQWAHQEIRDDHRFAQRMLRREIGVTTGLVIIIIGLYAVLIGLGADSVVQALGGDEVQVQEIRQLFVSVIRWSLAFFIFDAMQVMLVHMLRGFEVTKWPMLMTLGALWGVGLFGGLILAYGVSLGAAGLWAGWLAAFVVLAVGLLLCLVRVYRSTHIDNI